MNRNQNFAMTCFFKFFFESSIEPDLLSLAFKKMERCNFNYLTTSVSNTEAVSHDNGCDTFFQGFCNLTINK